ncbi:MAG TPA: 2-dehydropantoate 2-reductase [Thermoleophilaceae bacterium]
MTSIAILGPGGVGGFLAAALARAGAPVTVVAREPTAAAIERDGLRVESRRLGDFHARPQVATAVDGPADALIVATKAGALDAALERVRAEPRLVLPLLNGLDHLGPLRERFGTRAVAGSIRIEAYRTEPTHVVQSSPFLRIDMASSDPAMREQLDALATALERAEVPARVMASEAQAMWGKLVRLNALALTTSAYDLPLGPIRNTPELRDELEEAVREAAAVAAADGADVDPAATMGELADAHATLGSSMQRDIAAGVEPELDAIAGSVLRAAARHGVPCPTIERLAERVAARAGPSAPMVASG